MRLFRHREQGKKDWQEMMERVTEQVEEEIKVEENDLDTAIHYFQSGNLVQAETLGIQALQKSPNNADTLHLLGLIAMTSDQLNIAIDYFVKAIKNNPNKDIYYYDLGNAFAASGLLKPAIERYKKSLELNPGFAEACNNMGNVLFDSGMKEVAVEYYKKAIALKPGDALNYFNLGNTLNNMGMSDEAIECYKKATDLNPNDYDSYNNLGIVFAAENMMSDAVDNFRKAILLNPGFSKPYTNIGKIHADLGMTDEAIWNYRKALSVQPDDSTTHNNLAKAYLLAKDFEKGWEKFEWRLRIIKVSPLLKPKWDGSSLNGKTILVYHEQGYGDTIQFVRYLPELYDKFGARKVMFIPQKGLEQLLRDSDLKAEILDASIPADALTFDTNIHLLSLPRIFRTNLDNIPFRQKRYLKANPEKVRKYHERFFSDVQNDKYKIGIFWQGFPDYKGDRNRSMPLHYFYPLCRLPGIKLYSLQKGYGIEQLNDLPEDIDIVNLGESFNDFSDTAAAVMNLDLVITVDTAIGHLSGALGNKTWILLPSHAEWRWHLDMDYSPWYEDVRLFRHKELGKKDWQEMMERIKDQVEATPIRSRISLRDI
jgi:tetratricopeptide (TPR) repeat protein